MTERADYLIHTTRGDRDLAAVCRAVYDAVADRTDIAFVDAYSDHADQMPDDIRSAQAWLRAFGAKQGRKNLDYGRYSRDPAIGIRVRPGDEIGWPMAQAYTPWSIAVELFDGEQRSIASFDECGMSIVVELTTAQADALGSALPDGHAIELLIDVHHKEKAAKRAARQERRQSRFGRLFSR